MDESQTVSIKLSAPDIIPGVAREVLNVLCCCARGLPADAAVWDLSLLQIEGSPVRKQTVLSWLDKAYQCTYGEPFNADEQQQQQKRQRLQQQQQQPQEGPEAQQPVQQQAAAPLVASEAGGEGAACQYDLSQGPTFTALTQLLLFADAVGSTRPLLQACAADLQQLRLRVLLPEAVPGLKRSLDLEVDCSAFWGMACTLHSPLGGVHRSLTFTAAAFPSFQAAVTEQAQQQVEALLYAAYKLELVQLAELVEGYIRQQVVLVSSILRGQLRPIMSERVMAAAAGFKQLQESLLLSRWCTAPCALLSMPGLPGLSTFTQPRMAPAAPRAEDKPLSFSAVMLENFATLPKGARGDIVLDLAKSSISFLGIPCPAQLLVGPAPCSTADAKALLGPSPLLRPPPLLSQQPLGAPAAAAAGAAAAAADGDDSDDG